MIVHRFREALIAFYILDTSSWMSGVDPASVLLSGNFGDGSHYIAMRAIGEGLVRRGHNVTFLVAEEYVNQLRHPEDAELFQFETFRFPGLKKTLEETYDELSFLTLTTKNTSGYSKLMNTFAMLNRDACKAVFADEALLERLSGFDSFVFNIIWPCGVFVKSYLERHMGRRDIHLVALSHTNTNPYILWEAGSPFFPSWQPTPGSKLTTGMNFFERLRNTLRYLAFIFAFQRTIAREPFKELINEYDLDHGLRYAINGHVSLYLINTDFALDQPFALMPSVVPVGGLTARPSEPLADDLADFMDDSGDSGVVLFSLGSYLTSVATAQPEVMNMFLDAFGRLSQKVIIQSKMSLPHTLPENVRVLEWLPLNDLLGHPKTRLLVYHGGANGLFEAVYHGVPLAVMPLGADQFDIALNVVSKEIGVQIDKDNITADVIYQKLMEVLEHPKYSSSVRHISDIMRDRPMSARETSAFWIEHVVKHGGAYLRSPSLDLSFYQLYLLDVSAFLFAIASTITWLSYRCIKKCFRRN